MPAIIPPTRWRLRNRILLMVGLFAVAFGGPYMAPLWEMSDLDPGPTIPLGFLGSWASMLAWTLLAVWLIFFSYVPMKIRMVLLGLGVGGAILVQTEEGEIVSVPADTKKLAVQARFPVFGAKTWNTPALAGRCLYLRNEAEMACYELPWKE